MARRLLYLAIGLCLTIAAAPPPALAASGSGADGLDRAVRAARYFLDGYVDDDGRVVRYNQGGDTVSEGQAYAMLLSAGLGDEARFRQVWAWTQQHLLRDDGLLSFRWADGSVVDPMPAADADLIAAAALELAAARFGDEELHRAALALSDALIAGHAGTVGDSLILFAGPWATAARIVNPSYLVFPAMSQLWAAGDHRWADIAISSRSMLAAMTTDPPHLPPDWAHLAADGIGVAPTEAPGGGEIRYGYEAARAIVQLAVDCDPAGRALAAQTWPFFAGEAAGTVEAAYYLDGTAVDGSEHPLAYVGAAAAASAAGDGAASDRLLDRASELEGTHPTYYGAAWIAIGRLWLDTDLIGGCRA